MDDDPRPRKKSRFFSNGQSTIGKIFRTLHKPSRARSPTKTSQGSGGTSSSDIAAPFNGSSEIQDPRRRQDSANQTGNPSSETSYPTATFASTSSRKGAATHRDAQSKATPSDLLPETDSHVAPDGDVPTELDSEEGDIVEEQGCDAGGRENSPPTDRCHTSRPDRSVFRDRRRHAIYGIGGLMAAAANTPLGNGEEQSSGQCETAGGVAGVSGNGFIGAMRHPLATAPAQSTVTESSATQESPFSPQRPGPTTVVPFPNPFAARARGIPLYDATLAPHVDMDRDEHGRPLPKALVNPFAGRVASGRRSSSTEHLAQRSTSLRSRQRSNLHLQTPAHIADPESLVPEHMYTAPDRVERAKRYATISLKRKRPEQILPPPQYVYQHTNNPNFNIFDGFLLYPELVFALASVMPIKDLVSLYAISKDFHTILDTRFTTTILSQARWKARECAEAFMFRSYASLCRQDPAARAPHPQSRLAAQATPRMIPSFRWLKMVVFREKVINELMAVFAEDGIPLPFRCRLALKRMWYLIDIPDNARRIGLVHNRRFFTNWDLYFASLFFIKMDMRLVDPVSWEKRDGMRKLLMGQRSFTTILQVLKREKWLTKYDVMQEWIKYKYEPAEDERGLTIFGVAPDNIGRGRLEFWGLRTAEQLGREPALLMRPDQLIIREAFRRGMPFGRKFISFMASTYVRPDTLESYAPRKYGRRIAELKDDEYELDDMIGGVAALGCDDEGHDPLLDLGPPRRGSRLTIEQEKVCDREKEMRKQAEQFLDECVKWWAQEKGSMIQNEEWI